MRHFYWRATKGKGSVCHRIRRSVVRGCGRFPTPSSARTAIKTPRRQPIHDAAAVRLSPTIRTIRSTPGISASEAPLVSCKVTSRLEVLSQPDWILELECLSQASTAKQLNQWTAAGIGGIQAYGGATGVSFLPHLAPPSTPVGVVFTAIYQITDRCKSRDQISGVMADPKKPQPDGKTIVNPFSVQYVAHRFTGRAEDSGVVTLNFPLCQTTRRDLLSVTAFLTTDSLSNRENLPGFNFHSVYPLFHNGNLQNVRTHNGSSRLAFGTRGTPPGPKLPNDIYFRLPDPGPQIAIASQFIVSAILPGGQDDLPEDSFAAANAVVQAMPVCRTGVTPPDPDSTNLAVEQQFYRPRPLLINRNNSTDAPLVLTVSELTGKNLNRTVRLSVDVDNKISGPQVKQTLQQTLVLDADPFLVAQLSFPQLLSQTRRRE